MASTIFLNLNHTWHHSTTIRAGNQMKPIKSIEVKGTNIWITKANLLPLIFFFYLHFALLFWSSKTNVPQKCFLSKRSLFLIIYLWKWRHSSSKDSRTFIISSCCVISSKLKISSAIITPRWFSICLKKVQEQVSLNEAISDSIQRV